MFQDDEFALAFTAALDEVLAPAVLAIHTIDAYLDPQLAPRDFLDWLATWVGIELDETWPEPLQRDLVANAVDLYRWRGTKRGLAATIKLYAGVDPEIIDNGGTSFSDTPRGPLPGAKQPSLIVRVHIAEGHYVDEARINDLVTAAKPAYLPHTIEVVRG